MCSHGVLNRPFIAGKFSLRAPNKLPPYPYETTTLHLLKNHTAPTNYHTTSTKATNTTRSSGKNREIGAQIKEEILQEEKQLEEYVLLHTASSSFF